MVEPTAAQIIQAIGGSIHSDLDECDVVIIGAGLAGLRAAVYAASEGLQTFVLEETYHLVCTGPVRYTGQSLIQRDIQHLKAAVKDVDPSDVFMPAVSPARSRSVDAHYANQEEYTWSRTRSAKSTEPLWTPVSYCRSTTRLVDLPGDAVCWRGLPGMWRRHRGKTHP